MWRSTAFQMLVFFCVTFVTLCEAHSQVASQSLRFWLVFNLPAAAPAPSEPTLEEFLDTWRRRGIYFNEQQPKATANDDFRRQLFGQTAILEQIASFRTKNPAVSRVDVSFFGWDEYWDSLRSAPVALRPDLLQIPSTWCSSLATGLHVLSALPREVDRDARRRYTSQLLEPCLVYGESPLYGLPWLVDTRMFYYWKSDLPTLERELLNSGQVRDSFRQVLQASDSLKHPLFGLPTARDWELLHQTALLVWGEGGNLVETRQRLGYHWSAAALKEPALRGAEFIRNLAKERLIVLPRESRQDLELKFANHELGSVISGPWLAQQLHARGLLSAESIGIALPPLYERIPVTFVGGSFLGLTGRSPAETASALALAEFLSAGEGALPIALAVGLLPGATAARGTASGAIQRQRDLKAGSPCATYFECLVAAGYPPSVPETFERALASAQTYPPLPLWWTLEVPARLGSLYHLWQEVAALQPRDSLAASLQTVSDEWDASLRAFHRRLVTIGIGLTIAIPFGVWASVWMRRNRRELLVRQHELLARQRELEEAIAALEQEGKEREQGHRAVDLLKQFLEELKTRSGGPSQTIHKTPFEIVLPTYRDRHLRIIKNGRPSEAIDAMAARMIERVVRQSLLTQHPTSFSLFVAALDSWPTPRELPKAVRARWEAIVAEMRRAFDAKKWQVISRGKNMVYEFVLDESSYECLIGPVQEQSSSAGRTFVEAVRDPFQRAKRLLSQDPPAALIAALEAHAAERDLIMKDAEVVTLACRLGANVSATLTTEQQDTLRDAREELLKLRDQYQVFFENYTAPEQLLQGDKKALATTDLRALKSHWEMLLETRIQIEEAAGTVPASISSPPAAIQEAWGRAEKEVATLGRNRAQKSARFVEAYKEILDYWSDRPETLQPIIQELGALDPASKRKNRLHTAIQEMFANVLLEALLDGGGGDRRALLKRLENAFIEDCWKSPRDGSSPILLEMVVDRDRARETYIRETLRQKSKPRDLRELVELLTNVRGLGEGSRQ
jgi:ABC-type glycerol-3-phosphate transport system substrate-binding protein